MKAPKKMDPEKVAAALVLKMIDAAIDLEAFRARFVEGAGAQVLEDDWRQILAEELGRLRLAPFLPAPAMKPGHRPASDVVPSDVDAMRRYAELCLRGPERAWEVGFYFDDYSADLVKALANSIIVLADAVRERIRIGPPGGRGTKRQRRAERVIDAFGGRGRLALAELMKKARLKDRQALGGAISWANDRLLDGERIEAVRSSGQSRGVVAYELVSINKPMALPLPDGGDLMFDQATTE